MKVGYLGPKGSFSSLAAQKLAKTATLIPYDSIYSLVSAYELAKVSSIVLPVENTIEGSVLPVLDQLFRLKPRIAAEYVLTIKQHLLIQPHFKDQWQAAVKICSHPQAIAQVQPFIQTYLPHSTVVLTDSTTAGAKLVAKNPTEIYVAVGSKAAAKEFGLTIAKSAIQSVDQNQTRFWLLGAETRLDQPSKMHKATLVIDLKHDQPGALYQILAIFANANLNLTKIESRPKKTQLGEYFFLLEVALPAESTKSTLFSQVLTKLSEQRVTFSYLGSYPVY